MLSRVETFVTRAGAPYEWFLHVKFSRNRAASQSSDRTVRQDDLTRQSCFVHRLDVARLKSVIRVSGQLPKRLNEQTLARAEYNHNRSH